LPADNFEFLADYNPVDNLHFLTDLASLSVLKHAPNMFMENDKLHIKFEKGNEYDNEGVIVYKDDFKVGYIKKIHCRVFHKEGGTKLKLKVKAIDKNGIIKRAFVKVYTE
jgi:hypothetical protein